MRQLVPSDGLFKLRYPLNCWYRLSKGHTHDFIFEKGIGSLHLSVIGEKGRKKYEEIISNPNITILNLGDRTIYEIRLPRSDSSSIIWLFDINGVLFLATYYCEEPDLDGDIVKNHIKAIHDIFTSIEIIKESKRKNEFAWYKFGKFIASLGASQELFSRASAKGCFIECVCILANQIDALLRTAIILFDQNKNKNRKIDLKLIYQSTHDEPIVERKIYKQARKKEIIDKNIYDELNETYNERNKVVHRYIISEITTMDLLHITERYKNLKKIIYDIVYELESKQIESGYGMTIPHEKAPTNTQKHAEENIRKAIEEKHGGLDITYDNKNEES
ncbi:MAG: hypothetical protein ABIE74_11210 [Pseudomonadota bacterium]